MVEHMLGITDAHYCSTSHHILHVQHQRGILIFVAPQERQVCRKSPFHVLPRELQYTEQKRRQGGS